MDNIQSVDDDLKYNNYTLGGQAIINILEINSKTTQNEIAMKSDKSLRTVKIYMAKTQEKGLIERKMVNGK